MLTTLILSKNRACQLDLLIRSIQQNLPEFYDTVGILYKYTDDFYKQGYEKLIEKYPNILFFEEQSFKIDLVNMIRLSKDIICFMVDDNVIYRSNDISIELIHSFLSLEDTCCFSMRLGLNIELQDTYHQIPIRKPSRIYKINDKWLMWDRTTCHPHTNFGYAFSVDGHIYNKYDIVDNTNFEFNGPNAFEGNFNTSNLKHIMFSPLNSVLVNLPVNDVANFNKSGQFFPISVSELNQKFLDGYIINLDSVCENNFTCCHQEIPLELEK